MVEHLLLSQRTGVRVPAPTWMLTTVTSVLGDSTLSLVSKSIYIHVHTPPPAYQNTKQQIPTAFWVYPSLVSPSLFCASVQ